MSTPYDVTTDPVIQALITEAEADPDVIGLVLTGSRAFGGIMPESDYDGAFVVPDPVLERYTEQGAPPRGITLHPPVAAADLWHVSPRTLHPEHVVAWMRPAWAAARVLYDRTGEVAPIISALRLMGPEVARAEAAAWYDTYLNGLYRSLKTWRRGDELGGRLEAAQTADSLLHLLFALERHWRPYSNRLTLRLDTLAGQGWQPDNVRRLLLDLITTGDPRRQQDVARQVITLLHDRGFDAVYAGWEGQIDRVLAWTFA